MDILSLRLRLTDGDLLTFVHKHASPEELAIEELAIRITPEGVRVGGYYPLFIRVKFETIWNVAIVQEQISIQLADVKAMGAPASIFRSAIMKAIQDMTRKHPAIRFEQDRGFIDVESLTSEWVCPARLHLRAIHLGAGELILEAGQA